MPRTMLERRACVKASVILFPILTCNRPRACASLAQQSLEGSIMTGRIFFVVASIFAAFSISVEAQQLGATKYTHYVVAGSNAAEIVSSLDQRGPRVYGKVAHATTLPSYDPQPKFQQHASSCRISEFDYQLTFTIKLPRLENKTGIKGKTLVAWTQFESFVKRHEEKHRQIWLSCAGKHATEVRKLTASNCSTLRQQASTLWAKNKSACDKQHAAFDAAERSPLKRQLLKKLAKSNQ
jgi:predicted secreted Zn-dependent protease